MGKYLKLNMITAVFPVLMTGCFVLGVEKEEKEKTWIIQ